MQVRMSARLARLMVIYLPLPRYKAGTRMALKMKKDVCEGCRQGFGKEGVKVVNGFRYCKNCADYTMKYQGMLFY